jgi:hypothetical protein
MLEPSLETRILAEEQPAIEMLARETDTAIVRVQAVFLQEYAKIAAGAHITAFLPLLACSRVRAALRAENAQREGPPRDGGG